MDAVVIYQIFSIISVTSSLFVILTFFMSNKDKRKIFKQIIVFISICDICANFPYLRTSRPNNDSVLCSLEGFFHLFFYSSSWLWTLMLMYFLYNLALKGKLPISNIATHAICWIVPLVLTLLNLTTNNYTRFRDDDQVTSVCTRGGNLVSGFIWHMTAYYGLFLFCVASILYFYMNILKLKNSKKLVVSEKFLDQLIVTFRLYPLVMLICWLPELIAQILFFTASYHSLFVFTVNLKIMNGFFTSFIFFYKSESSRLVWIRLATQYLFCHEVSKRISKTFERRIKSTSDLAIRDSEETNESFSLRNSVNTFYPIDEDSVDFNVEYIYEDPSHKAYSESQIDMVCNPIV